MLTARRSVVSWSRGRRVGVAALGAIGASATYLGLSSDPSARGARRQARFWSRAIPVVWDYWWFANKSSPYARLRYDRDETSGEVVVPSGVVEALHEKHAPALLDAMVELKGLYVKLGQVLSVTALPVPRAYRERFRTLQSDVPGHVDFESTVRPVLEFDLGSDGRRVEDVFSSFDPIPCGAASIGQAHRATLRGSGNDDDDVEVVVKVQYPDASWSVPADVRCVGDLSRLCAYFGVVDEEAARLSFEEFARQFTAELDYERERANLEEIRESSLDPDGPYARHGVVVPKVYGKACGPRVITMSYLAGPKLEVEAKRRLVEMGVAVDDNENNLAAVVRSGAAVRTDGGTDANSDHHRDAPTTAGSGAQLAVRLLGLDNVLRAVGLYSRARSVLRRWKGIGASDESATRRDVSYADTERMIHALFDVHGHQIFALGLFNADPHPGNLLLLDENENNDHAMIGLIDFGQCKRLDLVERADVARLLLSVADDRDDVVVADAFRRLGVRTANDSTEFLARLARLMFGEFRPHHLDPAWHRETHRADRVVSFPQQLSMVYRAALLLRGLGLSLRVNRGVAAEWEPHAREALERYERETTTMKEDETTKKNTSRGNEEAENRARVFFEQGTTAEERKVRLAVY